MVSLGWIAAKKATEANIPNKSFRAGNGVKQYYRLLLSRSLAVLILNSELDIGYRI